MDKDFDKLQEFVELMKVSTYRGLSVGQHHTRTHGGRGQTLPWRSYRLVGDPNTIAIRNQLTGKYQAKWELNVG